MKSGVEDRVEQVKLTAQLRWVIITLPAQLMALKSYGEGRELFNLSWVVWIRFNFIIFP